METVSKDDKGGIWRGEGQVEGPFYVGLKDPLDEKTFARIADALEDHGNADGTSPLWRDAYLDVARALDRLVRRMAVSRLRPSEMRIIKE